MLYISLSSVDKRCRISIPIVMLDEFSDLPVHASLMIDLGERGAKLGRIGLRGEEIDKYDKYEMCCMRRSFDKRIG